MKHFFGIFLRGLAMGAADVVPGVSGGTIAFITGIYSELLHSLSRFNLQFITTLKTQGVKAAWLHINGNFLLSLGLGIIVSILSLARLVTYLLDSQPLLVWSFFFGLIIASSVFVLRQMRGWNVGGIILLVAGIALAVAIGQLRPAEVVASNAYIFMAGAIAICAMILPGISGSFILLLLGVYSHVLGAIKALDLTTLALFGSGCVVGLLSFVRILTWLLDHYHQRVIALLAGFIAGSLYLVWPWKEVLSVYTDSHGIEQPLTQANVLPADFELLTGHSAQLLPCIFLMFSGLLVVYALEKLGEKKA
ncbi:MAG: putative membrane protein [Marinobacter maritimus]|jgi:putative membrane protein